MDVSFTNILEGARPYFQGLPSANAADGPYFPQQPQHQNQQPSHQQVIQQHNHHHQQQQQQQQQHQKQFYQQINDQYAGASTNATTVSHWQQNSSEPVRPPTRERTPVSHSSTGSRPPSHSSSPYQEVRSYQNNPSYPEQNQNVTFQFTRPQSQEQQITYQQTSQVSREQHYQQQQPKTASSQQFTYQSRAYYPQTSKTSTNYMLPPQTSSQQQQMYYKHQMAAQPMTQSSYNIDNRVNEISSQGNGQYQTNNIEQTYIQRTTHNLPPIAALSNYRPNKTAKELPKPTLPRSKQSYPATMQQNYPLNIQQPQSNKVRHDPYTITSSNTNNFQTYSTQQQMPTVITQSYTNVIVTASNTSANQYQRTKHEVVPQVNQNVNRMNNVAPMGTSVIKQRKESPLDLSVKTVRTSADSTEGKSKSKPEISGLNYPTLDINNSIERSLNQRLPSATAPKVEFHPNFNLSSRHSTSTKTAVIEDSTNKHMYHSLVDYNKHLSYDNIQRYPAVSNTQQHLPKNNDYNHQLPHYQMYAYEAASKRPAQVDSPVVPAKIPKVESWREYIDHQIEEKFTSHYKQQQQQLQDQHRPIQQQAKIQHLSQPHKLIDEAVTSALMNGSRQEYVSYQNNMYNNKITYQQAKNNHVPSSGQYSSYYNTTTTSKQHLYINPVAARHNSNPPVAPVNKPHIATGADKRVLSLLRNSIETKELKKIEQLQKAQDNIMSVNQRTDIQHPSTDVTAPLQPKPGIDRNNISPFTPISVPDPNICKMPPKVIVPNEEMHMHITPEASNVKVRNDSENTVIMSNSNNDYDGLAARIRTKGELKEVAHSNAARDARIQAFLEDAMKSPNRQHMNLSGSSSASPPKLLKERQGVFAPRKRLFSRNDEETNKSELPRRDKSSMRSSSETSVFDFPDSEDENEMPVLERQTLDAMRKDRRNSLKQSTTPLHNIEADGDAPKLDEVVDDIFGSICDNLMEQLKCGLPKLVKRTAQHEIKMEPPESPIILTKVKVKVEAVEASNCSEISQAKQIEIKEESPKTPVVEKVIKSDSDLSDSEIKIDQRSIARFKHRVRRKILSSSESSDNESAIKTEKTDAPDIIESASKDQKITVETDVKVKLEPDTEESKNKGSELRIVRPAKKPPFGDGSDFYPGWEEGVYKYKKSLRMPPSLIQLTRPPTRLSTSLPDLDPCPRSPTTSISNDVESIMDNKKFKRMFKSELIDSDSESTSSFNVFDKKNSYESEDSLSIKSMPNTRKENMSILDKLLEKCGGRKKRNHKRKDDHSPKVIPKAENSVELLATPIPGLPITTNSPEKPPKIISTTSAVLPFRKDTINNFKDAFINSGDSILGVHDKFTTIVMSSRTRKETRAMKQRVTIKEVFGEDRPASAPPVPCINDIQSKIEPQQSFSKNLEDILIKTKRTSDIELEDKNSTKIKQEIIEDDEENKKLSDFVTKKDTDAYSETMSLDGEDPGLGNKRRHKYGKIRRKFSSGFDYIRKKKKNKKEETDSGYLERKKKKSIPAKTPETIDDIQKEVKSWVLNKGIGESHLHRAARLGYVDLTAYCLEKMDCPPNPKDNAGYTPLHEACARGHLEIAKLLLKYGANVHESAKGGIRPLHEAIENGFVEIVRLLLSYGADPCLATYAGVTPLSLATDENTKKLLSGHLSDKSGEGGSPWHFYGPASCFDPEESGYDALSEIPKELSESELDDIEIDISEALLPNLYTLRGEPPTERWVLLQDLSHFLKIKSRDALLRQICPSPASSSKVNHKNVLRELKMSEFLELAHCCQFLNMGEKINNRASKIALVRYTDRVRELLGIESAVVTAR